MACEDPESENCKHAGWAISFSIPRHGMMPISVAAKRTAFGGIPVRFTKEKAALNCLEFSWPLVVNWSNHGSVPSPGGYFNIPRSCNKVPCSGMRWLHALYLNIEHWWHNYSTKLKTTVRQTALQPSCPTFCQKPQALLSERRTLALHPLSIASAQVMAVESLEVSLRQQNASNPSKDKLSPARFFEAQNEVPLQHRGLTKGKTSPQEIKKVSWFELRTGQPQHGSQCPQGRCNKQGRLECWIGWRPMLLSVRRRCATRIAPFTCQQPISTTNTAAPLTPWAVKMWGISVKHLNVHLWVKWDVQSLTQKDPSNVAVSNLQGVTGTNGTAC